MGFCYLLEIFLFILLFVQLCVRLKLMIDGYLKTHLTQTSSLCKKISVFLGVSIVDSTVDDAYGYLSLPVSSDDYYLLDFYLL
ncbi:unnamed protein product [Meloidogyne enterolobii]|uniref:Uncharacterized protein n=1 Tax=Meloidogyne enterolobii TaxID=390850 RepID=A0ACB0XWJ2_MELEN